MASQPRPQIQPHRREGRGSGASGADRRRWRGRHAMGCQPAFDLALSGPPGTAASRARRLGAPSAADRSWTAPPPAWPAMPRLVRGADRRVSGR